MRAKGFFRIAFIAGTIICFAAFLLSFSSSVNDEEKPKEENALVLNYHLMHPGELSHPGDPDAAFFLDGICK